jgi:hypothetical protein
MSIAGVRSRCKAVKLLHSLNLPHEPLTSAEGFEIADMRAERTLLAVTPGDRRFLMPAECDERGTRRQVERQRREPTCETQRHRAARNHPDDAVIDWSFDGAIMMQPQVGNPREFPLSRTGLVLQRVPVPIRARAHERTLESPRQLIVESRGRQENADSIESGMN